VFIFRQRTVLKGENLKQFFKKGLLFASNQIPLLAKLAKLAELVDAVVLGAILKKVQVQILCFANKL
jgi:hypothetical protein